jgi:hypothetical protein
VSRPRSGSIGDGHKYLNFGIFMSTPTTPAAADAVQRRHRGSSSIGTVPERRRDGAVVDEKRAAGK